MLSKKEHPYPEELTEIPLRRDEHFIEDAEEILRPLEPSYPGSTEYRLHPGLKQYSAFLNSLLESLRSLPLNNEIGRTIFMRPDARSVINQLIQYLADIYKKIGEQHRWDKKSLSSIANIFTHLEVFKNEIYPGANTSNVCYSLDLGAHFNEDKSGLVPDSIILERFFVSATSGELEVHRNGRFMLFLNDGELFIDLDKHTANKHYK